ncbi:MAG: beta-glucanase, partial [Bacteroidaceae bacterium]|nr:beta-glucanase [Bacteroidaceae bacterium]
MKRTIILLISAAMMALPMAAKQQRALTEKDMGAIRSGELWLDDKGEHINAHGGGIMKYGDTYYWF